jgi:hypothetical protein
LRSFRQPSGAQAEHIEAVEASDGDVGPRIDFVQVWAQDPATATLTEHVVALRHIDC